MFFRNEDQRGSFWAAVSLAAIVLAIVGHFAFGGIIGGVVVVVAVVANVVATLYAPQVPGSFYGAAPFFFGGASTVVSLIVGCIVFGWWGIAYAFGSLVGYLLSTTTR